MSVRLFNTLTQSREPLEPRVPGKVALYVCGPTVYDLSHIGHARCYVAFDVLVRWLRERGSIENLPVRDHVAAVSVGVVGHISVLDLDYVEDAQCETDMNVVMTGRGRFVELQGTAEGEPFSDEEMAQMVALARKGIAELVAAQKHALELG